MKFVKLQMGALRVHEGEALEFIDEEGGARWKVDAWQTVWQAVEGAAYDDARKDSCLLCRIASAIGKPLYADSPKRSRGKMAYAWCCVEVSVEESCRPRAIFMAFGTKGDVLPIAAIATALASDQKHYNVVLITHLAHQSLSGHLAAKKMFDTFQCRLLQ